YPGCLTIEYLKSEIGARLPESPAELASFCKNVRRGPQPLCDPHRKGRLQFAGFVPQIFSPGAFLRRKQFRVPISVGLASFCKKTLARVNGGCAPATRRLVLLIPTVPQSTLLA